MVTVAAADRAKDPARVVNSTATAACPFCHATCSLLCLCLLPVSPVLVLYQAVWLTEEALWHATLAPPSFQFCLDDDASLACHAVP